MTIVQGDLTTKLRMTGGLEQMMIAHVALGTSMPPQLL